MNRVTDPTACLDCITTERTSVSSDSQFGALQRSRWGNLLLAMSQSDQNDTFLLSLDGLKHEAAERKLLLLERVLLGEQSLGQESPCYHDESVAEPTTKDGLFVERIRNECTDEDCRPVDK